MVRGMLNTLPTPANKRLWQKDHKAVCNRCERYGVDLKHILNDCVIGKEGGLTRRHDDVFHDVYGMIKKEIGEEINVFLEPRLQALRPDLWFRYTATDGRQTIELVDVIIAHAIRTKGDQDTLTDAYEYKECKYAELREQLSSITGMQVNLPKYCRRLSLTALEGSYATWRKFNAYDAAKGPESSIRNRSRRWPPTRRHKWKTVRRLRRKRFDTR
jgi:hypothetical protein